MSDLKMSDLPRDMVEEEVLSRLPVTSLREVRSTCKKWNTLTKGESFLKKHIKKKQSKEIHQVVMMLEYRVSLMSVNLLCPSVECIGNLDAGGQVDDISKIIHCDGLFLLRMTKTKDDKISSIRLVVWNPYLGQTRWIEPRNSYHKWDRYALGYEKKSKCSKVLRFVNNYDPHAVAEYQICEFEIYSLNSNAWKLVDVNPDWNTSFNHRGVSLKGNTYWYAQQKIPLDAPPVISDLPDFLLSFDFTTERFGPRLPLPFHGFFGDTIALSSVRGEQLAVLFQKRKRGEPVKIWITTKIEPNAVSWSNLFLAVDMKPLVGFCFDRYAGSFFVDEEKNVAVVLDKDRGTSNPPTRNIAYIIGKNDYMKQVDLGESRNRFCHPLVCSYVPSSVQIEQPAPLGNVLLY